MSWSFLVRGIVIGFSIAAGLLATQWANRALVDQPGSIPGGSVAAWFQSWLWTPLSGLFALLVLLFPTGRLLSRRWRFIAWLIAFLLRPREVHLVRRGR